MEVTYTVSINGQRAVNRAYEINNGHCYTGIYINSERVAQMEVVLDEDGTYNGWAVKWVDVSYVKPSDVENVIAELSRMGFGGCKAVLMEDHIEEDSYIIQQKEIKEFIIPENTEEPKEPEEDIVHLEKFRDIETGDTVSTFQLYVEYTYYLTDDERAEQTFRQYLNNCLTINGGTLERITNRAIMIIGEKEIECKIVAVHRDNTIRVEFPCYDYMGRYNGYGARTVNISQIKKFI